MSSTSLPESGTRTPPSIDSSPIDNVQPYFLEHKRHEVHNFEEHVQQRNTITPEHFLKCLGGGDSDDPLPSHVLSKPSKQLSEPSEPKENAGPVTVLKVQLCRSGRLFTEWEILSKIHQPMRVPGVVEAVDHQAVDHQFDAAPSRPSPERRTHLLGLRQTGSPFTSIPTAKKMLETLFDLLEVLRFLRFERRILHRDISVGNVMYVENPEIPAQGEVEPLVFAKYLLKEGAPQETSLLLVDFNVGEDLGDKKDEEHINRTETRISISRAVERGGPVPLHAPFYLEAKVPKSPECYAKAHARSNRIGNFPEEIEGLLVDPSEKLMGQSQNKKWRHELDHDVESVFWLLLYWAMVAQPKGRSVEYIHPPSWHNLLGDSDDRDRLVKRLSLGDAPANLTHSFYAPLWPLIRSLAATLIVDKHWLPQSDVRQRPDYICEVFQRLFIEFLVSNTDKAFMTYSVDDLRKRPVLDFRVPRDGSERGAEVIQVKRRRLNSMEDEGNESSLMIQ